MPEEAKATAAETAYREAEAPARLAWQEAIAQAPPKLESVREVNMLTERKIKELLKSGNWMIRTSDNGKSYMGFQWKQKGKWTSAPDWNSEPLCGNGLHGQNDSAHGYFQISGQRLDLCETKGEQVMIDTDKLKVKEAKIIATDEDIPPVFLEAIGLQFSSKPSLRTLTSVGRDLHIDSKAELPNLTSVGGYLYVGSRAKLPALTSVGGVKGKFANGRFVGKNK